MRGNKAVTTTKQERIQVRVSAPLSPAEEELGKLEQALDEIETLQMRGLDPYRAVNYEHNRHTLANLLRVLLSLHGRWLQLASGIYTLTTKVESQVSGVRHAVHATATYAARVTRGQTPGVMRADDFGARMPDEGSYLACLRLVRRWNEFLRRADRLWRAFEPYRQPPEYRSVKKIMPIGGRDAYSLLCVVRHGWTSDSKPDYERLFGWLCYTDDSSRYVSALRNGARNLRAAAHEKGGAAPTWASGCRLVRGATLPHRVARAATTRSARLAQLLESGLVFQISRLSGLFLGEIGYNDLTPSLVLRAWKNAAKSKRWVRLLGRIVSLHERNPTLLTGRPVCISEAFRVYKVPAAWTQSNRTVTGWVLVRRGWSDLVHRADPDVGAQLDDAGLLQLVMAQSRRALNERRDPRKAIADVCRKLRAVPRVRMEDSFRVGNCEPGTHAFMRRLGLSAGAEIPGAQLVRLWRKANYCDRDRLENVADALLSG